MAPEEAPHSITVAIERRIAPAHDAEAAAWMQIGGQLASAYPGFLGSGWVRPEEGSDLWYVLYRFRDLETLEAWESSDTRREWLATGTEFAHEVRVERRTGIEGWFDATSASSIDSRSTRTAPVQLPVPSAPPRWKQAVSIWIGFYPTTLLVTWLTGFIPVLADLPLPLRLLLTTLVMTPLMTYLILPWVTRMLRPWLHPGT
jgi:uncharacterized protein